MITIPTNPDADRQFVILRRRGEGWSALRATLDQQGVTVEETTTFDNTTRTSSPQATEEASPPQATIQSTIEAWLEKHGNPAVYMLLPAGLTISRVLELTPENDEDLDQTLRLQAESHLLGGAPPHRVGMSTLPARAHSDRQGIVITWPESSIVETPPIAEQPLCIPETAALLALAPTTTLESPLLHVDRTTGSLAVVLEVENGLVVRSTREQQKDTAAWEEAVTHAVVETAVTANEPLDQIENLRDEIRSAIEGRDELLLLPASVRSFLQDSIEGSKDEDWWQEWGLSVGALLAATGDLQALTNLRARKEVRSTGVVGEVTRSLSQPGLMAAILIAAIFAITMIPMVGSWIRLSIIEGKIQDQAQLEVVLANAEQQKGVYNEIAKRSWPMTKLLGDLANCIPLGIEAETIIVQEGDSIILRGSVGEYKGKSPTDLLQEMLERLEKTNIFTDFNSSEEPVRSGGRAEFSITLRVKTPFKQIRNFDHDFAKVSHQRLRYPHAFKDDEKNEGEGEGESTSTQVVASASNESEGSAASTPATTSNSESRQVASSRPATTPSRSSGRGSSSDSAAAPPGVGRSSLLGPSRARSSSSSSRPSGSIQGSTGGATRRSQSTGARGSSGPAPVPEAFTDSELTAMSQSEAKGLLTRVAQARQRDDLDDATKERLKKDFDRILEHMRVLQATNSGGGG